MIKKLRKRHKIICTSRKYREVTDLAKMRKMNLISAGSHGGAKKYDKLKASIGRTRSLSQKIKKFSPDITVSFCSPEAARISYGMGIKHVAFCDSPHAEAVMRLTIPLVNKLLIPWIIPKKEFTKFGINKNKIISYKAIDASIIIKNKIELPKKNLKLPKKKILLIRAHESEAAYSSRKGMKIIPIIQRITQEFSDYNVVLLARYPSQIKKLKKKFGKKITILDQVVNNNEILSLTDIFVGSGGTMTAEAALRGIPCISYNAVPNLVENYLVKKGLVKREEDPKKIVALVRKLLKSDKKKIKKRAKIEVARMEDPFTKLITAIESITA